MSAGSSCSRLRHIPSSLNGSCFQHLYSVAVTKGRDALLTSSFSSLTSRGLACVDIWAP